MTVAPPSPDKLTMRRLDSGPTLVGVLRRHWWLIVVCALVLGAVGYVIGQQRDPTYTAESRLTVANVNFETRSVPGFTQAVLTLTSSYSEAVDNEAVVAPVARRLGLDQATVADHLSATPVPDSSVFVVKGTGARPAPAIAIANAAAAEVARYASTLDDSGAQRDEALKTFRDASRDAAQIQERIDALRGRRKAGENVPSSRIVHEQEALATASLQADSARATYTQLVAGSPSADARTISVLSPARTATSDKSSMTQRYVLIGLIAGAALGFVLASLIPLASRRRLS